MPFAPVVSNIHDFIAVGYANTLGWAHAHSGDTMTSVMIGGLRTVMNGDFPVFTGDLIQWYWPFERECFTRDGRRKKIIINPDNNLIDFQVDPATGEAADKWNLDKSKE